MPKQFFTGTISPIELPNLQWSQLEAMAQLTFSAIQRQTLLVSLNRYLTRLVFEHRTPQTKDVQRQLQRIHRAADELASLLRVPQSRQTPTGYAPPDEREFALHEAVMGAAFPFDVIAPHELIRAVLLLSQRTDVAMTALRRKSQRGRQDKEALDVMIREWHAVYIQAGGSNPGWTRSGGASQASGPFLDLLDGAFRQVPQTLLSLAPEPLRRQVAELQHAFAEQTGDAARQTGANLRALWKEILQRGGLPPDPFPPTRNALAQRIRAALRPL